MELFHHEQIYRGKAILDKIKNFPMVICGAGAIGSNLAENLARQGFTHLTVIDKDRVQLHNINTQVWTHRDIGAQKASILRYRIFEITGAEIAGVTKELDSKTKFKRFVKERVSLVVDAFDNSKSRQLVKDFCLEQILDCVHIGFSGDYGEIVWNEDYRVPDEQGEDDCDYPLARNLIMLLVGAASEVIVRFITQGRKDSYTLTLKDFKIKQKESFR